MTRVAMLGAVLAFLSCGHPPDEPGVATRADEIVGGMPSLNDPAVVALAAGTGGASLDFCSGTLIAPATVLTAAHCIWARGADVDYAVLFGPESTSPTRVVRILEQHAHPSYDKTNFDFGVVRLAEAVADVTVIPMNESPVPSQLTGEPIRHVGYGRTLMGTSGARLEVTVPLASISTYLLGISTPGKVVCQGDSGGPGLMVFPGSTVEKVAGVISFGDSNCGRYAWDSRMDVGASWVRQTMAAWETPSCESHNGCVPGCTPVDQDCACATDGTCGAACLDPKRDADCPFDCRRNAICATQPCGIPDVDCADEGGHCDGAFQCRARLCGTDPQRADTYCTSTCQAQSDCVAPMECAEGVCRFPQRPVRQLFETCVATTDFCTNAAVCVGPTGGFTRCVHACVTTSDCLSGSRCEGSSDSRRFCRPATLSFVNPTVPLADEVIGPAAPTGCSAATGSLVLGLALMLLRRRAAVVSRAHTAPY